MGQINQDAQLAYQTIRIRTASKEQLFLMVYDIAIKFCLAAESAIEGDSDIEGAHENLLKAQRAVRELMMSLDVETGGEVASNMMGLYDFMFRTLVEANVEKNLDKVQTVRSMLEELRDNWKQFIDKMHDKSSEKNLVAAGTSESSGINLAG